MSKERAELARCAEESEKQSEYEGGLLDRIAELEEELFKQSQESEEEVLRAIEIILEKDARIAELMDRIAKVELAFAVVEGRITEIQRERDDFDFLNYEIYNIIFTHLGWRDLEGVNEIDHDDIIKALKEQGK